MSFVDINFPEKWALDAERSIVWQNEIVATRNHREARNTPMAAPRYAWDLSMNAKRAAERAEFDDWFLAMQGQQHTFALRDPADHVMARQQVGTGDGTTTEFQLVKTYTKGSASFAREIVRPVTTTVQVWVNDILQESGVTVGRTTGLLTFSVAPAGDAVVEAACTFDVPVRFNQASLAWRIVEKNPSRGFLWICPGLSLIEVIGE